MRCKNCNLEVDSELNFCTNCGASLQEEDFLFELPELKTDKESEEENQKIDVFMETHELPIQAVYINEEPEILEAPSFEREQADEPVVEAPSQEEKPKEEQVEYVHATPIEKIDLSPSKEKEDIKTRKMNLVLAFFLLLVIIVLASYGLARLSTKNDKEEVNYENKIVEALEVFATSKDTTDLTSILDTVKNDEEIVKKLQKKTKDKVEEWTSSLEEKNAEAEDFEATLEEEKQMLKKLYDVSAQGKYGDARLFQTEEYKEQINKIDAIYAEAKPYLEALNYYNDKSYNEAFYMFTKVEDANRYSSDAKSYLDKITETIMDLIKTDITKMESGIETLSSEEQRNRFVQIEEIIRSYDSMYNNLELSKKEEYKNLLMEYQNKSNF